MLKRFKTVLNKATNEMEEVSGNILKPALGNKSFQHHILVIYDIETMV